MFVLMDTMKIRMVIVNHVQAVVLNVLHLHNVLHVLPKELIMEMEHVNVLQELSSLLQPMGLDIVHHVSTIAANVIIL